MLWSLIGLLMSPVFQSWESKNGLSGVIYNQVYFLPGDKRDIWYMQQVQNGLENNWDHIAIIVDRSTKPLTATYLQLEPKTPQAKIDQKSLWEIERNFKIVPHKVDCQICHTNGPRKIRPQPGSPWSLSIWMMNERMKSYSRNVQSDVPQSKAKHFRVSHGSCTKCHFEGPQGRGALSSKNWIAIKFLMESKLMPPGGENIQPEGVFDR